MFIAQHSVAGEGDLRPLLAHPPAVASDSEALAEFTCDTANLPWIIFRAAHRAAHLHGLPARSRALLAALARTVDADRPYAAIFARRELLTGRAMLSMRTFYRSLDDLESAGFITRAPQKRYDVAGLFGRSYLHLSEKATQILGLAATDTPIDTVEISRDREAADGKQTGISSAHPSATVADGAIYKDLDPKLQKRQSGTLPEDLQRLRELGFHEFLIFKLMREAKLQNKRLSDVVEATWEHLRKALHPINYLRTLIRSTVDFGHQVRAAHSARQQVDAHKAHAAQVIETAASFAGQSFYDAESNRRYDVSSSAEEVVIRDFREGRPRVARTNWQADFIAAIQAGHIVAATEDRQAAHAAKCRSPHDAHRAELKAPQPDSTPRRTVAIDQRLSEMKRLLRAACAGVVGNGNTTVDEEFGTHV